MAKMIGHIIGRKLPNACAFIGSGAKISDRMTKIALFLWRDDIDIDRLLTGPPH
ncbi:hypothetical protein KIN20_030421 [Parelaphostrongylus tenuis]|uniref:Uncharacterized protein n=1 Tax=Parelaphostrongylus tenuis TaxID=148309 RepID=A0AAD5R460_PARTN|nr:hypothetical protein KIN20_030421 [Parelaphostrongylus tenuis]